MVEYRNPNIFVPDNNSNITIYPFSNVSLRCPHCKQLGTFHKISEEYSYSKTLKIENTRFGFTVSIGACPNTECKGNVFIVKEGGKYISSFPPETIDFSTDNLPETLTLTLEEAIKCHASGAYRASTMMVRRLLEEICDINQAEGKDLHQRLEKLKTKIILPEALFTAMSELKALGNDAAHIKAKAYDSIGKEESEDSLELAKEILKALYQLDGLLKRLQSRKKTA